MGFGKSAVVFCLFAVLAGSEVAWAEPWWVSDLPPEYVIERIQELRRDWKDIEIEYASFEKHWDFDPPDSPAQYTGRGRFVITADNCGQLESWPMDGKGRNVPGETSTRLVWTPEEFQVHEEGAITHRALRREIREYQDRMREGALPTPDAKAFAEDEASDKESEEQEPRSLGYRLLRCLFSVFEFRIAQINLMAICSESPKACLPLVFADDVEKLTERFDLVVMENDEHLFLHAQPKGQSDQSHFREIALCLNRETFLPIAKRTVLPSGDDYLVCVVTSLRANGKEISLTAGPVPAKTP